MRIESRNGTVVLPDVSLCAIVRDEKTNPAGGIVDFVESTVPYLGEVVIVDTGSVDGTREELERLQASRPNLRVYDHEFDGFANSRNYSLSRASRERILVLDADERLTHDDFARLGATLEGSDTDSTFYDLRFLDVFPDGSSEELPGHNPRLFPNRGLFRYTGVLWEQLSYLARARKDSKIYIKHFVPSKNVTWKKRAEFYRAMEISGGRFLSAPIPSQCPSFAEWKEVNPFRKERYT